MQFAVVADPAAALEVATGPDGVAAGISAGAESHRPCLRDLLAFHQHCFGTVSGLRRWKCCVCVAAGKGYIDVSTIDAGTAQQIASAIRGAGAQYLEAPVSGSKQPAEKGQLIFLTAGLLSQLDCCAVLCSKVLNIAPACLQVIAISGTYARPLMCSLVLVAGDKELFHRASPMLEIMGKKSFFLGEVGQGAKMKLVINMVRDIDVAAL